MEFLKLYSDMERWFEPYSPEERGNLFSALMAYCFHGVEPDFSGNERFIWPVLRRHVDQCAEANVKNALNGQKGGRPKTGQNPTKPKETHENPKKPTETDENPNKAIQEQEQEQIQEQEQEGDNTSGEREWRPHESGRVIGIDGSDLSDAIRLQDVADGMIARYRLNRDEPTREKLLEDLAKHGESVMREVLETACDSNTRERVTARYWRAILQNRGKPRAKKTPEAVGYLTGSAHRDDEFFRGLDVDLDSETI